MSRLRLLLGNRKGSTTQVRDSAKRVSRLLFSLLVVTGASIFLAFWHHHYDEDAPFGCNTLFDTPTTAISKRNQTSPNETPSLWKGATKDHDGDRSSTLSKTNTTTRSRPSIHIDIISIGSVFRGEYQDAQQRAFGSHPAVRNFFRITEKHDLESSCHSNLTIHQVMHISRRCRSRSKRLLEQHYHLHRMRMKYASGKWLRKKANPVGWMCAQKRPADGFMHALKTYIQSSNNVSVSEASLPDYVLVLDDDTYVNLPLVYDFLPLTYPKHEAYAVAGCMVRSRINEHNFTFPFGGWGMIFTKAALQNLIRPIRCPEYHAKTYHKKDEDFVQAACRRLQENPIGEAAVFTPGMSLADLMHAYVHHQPYLQVNDWNDIGFCMHSDWVWGYFSNFYPVAGHTGDPEFLHMHDRLRGYNGSTLYAGRRTPQVLAQYKQCSNQGKTCTAQSHLCHYVSPADIDRLSGRLAQPAANA